MSEDGPRPQRTGMQRAHCLRARCWLLPGACLALTRFVMRAGTPAAERSAPAQVCGVLSVLAEQQAALAAELGGGALLEQCHQLQADLLNCQQV